MGQTYTGLTADSVEPNTVWMQKNNAFVSGLFSVRRYF
jgi:hypothetical protein